MNRLTYRDTERLRGTFAGTVLLFITDRCPVQCAHCSVDSLPHSPTITDYALFDEILVGIVALVSTSAVAISGGEPFSERKGLCRAVDILRDGGKDVVIFTSGYWAGGSRLQPWIGRVLSETSTVFLSTDSFHQGRVAQDRFRRAARHVADAGCRIVVQALDEGATPRFVSDVLADLYGDGWSDHADVVPIPPLRTGRGAGVFGIGSRRDLSSFGACQLTKAPTIRYDGTIIGCCNEALVRGAGPAALRRQVRSRDDVRAVIEQYRIAPLLRAVAAVPLHRLTALPALRPLADDRYEGICAACWRAHDLLNGDPESETMLSVLVQP
ncbi:MAG: hypothetical protein ACRDNZ_11365 [Streptosporangiaceae bacterium]